MLDNQLCVIRAFTSRTKQEESSMSELITYITEDKRLSIRKQCIRAKTKCIKEKNTKKPFFINDDGLCRPFERAYQYKTKCAKLVFSFI